MSHTVRVAFDESVFEEMEENAPAALQDPEVVRHYVSMGMMMSRVMQSGVHASIAGGRPDLDVPDSPSESADE